jgi:hypothetical protein
MHLLLISLILLLLCPRAVLRGIDCLVWAVIGTVVLCALFAH